MPGAGSIPFGGGPLGGSVPPSDFDAFTFLGATTETLLAKPYTHSTPDVAHVYALPDGHFEIMGDVSQGKVFVDFTVNDQFTVEWEGQLKHLPNDFRSLTDNYCFIGAICPSGPHVGLYLSKVGIAYTPALGGPTQILPHSVSFVNEEDRWTIRVAADYYSNSVYIFITKSDEVSVIGHQLRYVLPVLEASLAPTGTSVSGVTMAAKGVAKSTLMNFGGVSLATMFLLPNARPIADAGKDQSVRHGSIIRLDGTGSFDPEGARILYQWRLVDVPLTSTYSFSAIDGYTPLAASPPGAVYTDTFYSPSFDGVTIPVGSVLAIGGEAYTIIGSGSNAHGFYVRLYSADVLVGLGNTSFKIVLQNGILGSDTSRPTFYPDVFGFYKFDLVVYDGELVAAPSTVVFNVVETLVPRGVVPDLRFLWNYLSNFWNLVEEKERIDTFWSAAAQVAASDLLTIWQVDYNKSLRDIQRTFQRKWLNFEPTIAEPFIELSTTRVLYSGLDTAAAVSFTTAGETLELVWADGSKSITLPIAVLTPLQLTTFLNASLSGTSITATQIDLRGGTSVVRLSSTKKLTIGDATTSALFTIGATTGLLSGTGGMTIAGDTYKVSTSLLGLGIKEGDQLSLDGILYRVHRIADNASDLYPYQRLVLKDTPPFPASSDWSIPSQIISTQIDFWSSLVSAGDTLELEVVDSATEELSYTSLSVLGVCQGSAKTVAADLTSLAAYVDRPTVYSVYLHKVTRRSYLPLDPLIVDVPTLQEIIKEPSEDQVLRRNVDYFIDTYRDTNCLHFDSRVWQTPDALGVYVDDVTLPERLWAEFVYLDNRPTIEANFGVAVSFSLDQSNTLPNTDYLSAVRGLWYSYLNGPTLFNLRAGTQILLGLPFAEEEGTIEEIRTDYSPSEGRILIRDKAQTEIVRTYQFPVKLGMEINPATGAAYVVGDTVKQFAPLVTGVRVVDYIKDPTWYENYLKQGSFYEVEKFFKFLVRIDAEVFTLPTLLFCQSFIRRIKPTYTVGLFVVAKTLQPSDISVSDFTLYKGRLVLYAGGCFDGTFGAATMYDQPNPAGGGWKSKYDADADPGTALPLVPPPDTPVWGYDRLCPETTALGIITGTFAPDPSPPAPPGSFLPTMDSIFEYDAVVYTVPGDVATPWAYDTYLPAGTYCSKRTL